MENSTSSKRLCVSWLLLAALLLSLGAFALYSTLNVTPISNAEYLQLQSENKLPITTVSEDSFNVSYYGGIGFVVAGFVAVGITVLSLLRTS